MHWEATYNAVTQDKTDRFDITGWVTIQNMSGKDFENANVKLMAGDVARVQEQDEIRTLVGNPDRHWKALMSHQ